MTTGLSKRLLARDPALLSEAEWSGLVAELARLGGWDRRYHTLNSRGSTHGFPDWVFVKGPRLLFVELKSEAGKVRADQQEWIDALAEVGAGIERVCGLTLWVERDGLGLNFARPSCEVYVWRPSDYDEVVETLTGRKQRAVAA